MCKTHFHHSNQFPSLVGVTPSLMIFLNFGRDDQPQTCGCITAGCRCHAVLPLGETGMCSQCAKGQHFTGDYESRAQVSLTSISPMMTTQHCACRVRSCVCVAVVAQEGGICNNCQGGVHKHSGGLLHLSMHPRAMVYYCNCDVKGCDCWAELPENSQAGKCLNCLAGNHAFYGTNANRLGTRLTQDDFEPCGCYYPGCECTHQVPTTNPGPCSSCQYGTHDLGSYHLLFSPLMYQPFQVVSITRFSPVNGSYPCVCSYSGCECTSSFDIPGVICKSCRKWHY